MYLTQYKEICEKQGWAFETCDNGKKVRITLKTLPSEHSFTVSKDNFAEQIKAVSESYLAKEYARIGHAASTTANPLALPLFSMRGLLYPLHSMLLLLRWATQRLKHRLGFALTLIPASGGVRLAKPGLNFTTFSKFLTGTLLFTVRLTRRKT